MEWDHTGKLVVLIECVAYAYRMNGLLETDRGFPND